MFGRGAVVFASFDTERGSTPVGLLILSGSVSACRRVEAFKFANSELGVIGGSFGVFGTSERAELVLGTCDNGEEVCPDDV
jgi:hypothetical protein